MKTKIVSHCDLEVYRKAFDVSMKIFTLSKQFPKAETYSLIDQIRRSSRSVYANLAEAWRKRRYEASFVCKLTDAEGEAAETQTWIQYAVRCGYLDRNIGADLFRAYEEILRLLVAMINKTESWVIASNR
jgi:four helix bundle protein